MFKLFSRNPVQLQGALINGLESRVCQIEEKLSDLDARGSEEHDNLANERELHRFIMTGISFTTHCLSKCYCFLSKDSLMNSNGM